MDYQFFNAMPKTELHSHLEGSIPLAAIVHLVEKYDGPKAVDALDIKKKYKYTHFDAFIKTWIWQIGYLREYEDFTLIGEAVANDLKSQNIIYSEMFYSPGPFVRNGMSLQKITESIFEGFAKVNGGADIRLICDFVRNHGQSEALKILPLLSEVKDLGVIGIGIGGIERDFPAELFTDLYKQAKLRGFHTTAHAGEGTSSTSVLSTIDCLEVERVGHGYNVWPDQSLMETIKKRNIHIEVCPTSNLRTGICSILKNHPVKHYLDFGLSISINSDDPTMFNTCLASEFYTLAQTFQLSKTDILKLCTYAIDAAWCKDEVKSKLQSVSEQFFNQVGSY